MTQAVILTGGKQYTVTKGARLLVDKIESKPGDALTLDQVLLISGGDSVQVGAPYLSGAKVLAKVVSQEKAQKVIVYKYKRRKGYHKKQGHRQKHTFIEITDIVA